MFIKKVILTLLFFFIVCRNFAFDQQKSFISLQFPKGLICKKIEITYYNGIKRKSIPSHFKNEKLIISDSLFGPYATLTVRFDSNNYNLPKYNTFFISNQPASIVFTSTGLAKYIATNAYSTNSIAEDYINYIKPEAEEFNKWSKDTLEKMQPDSFVFERNKFLMRQMINKKLDFFRLHTTNEYESYFSFEIFKNEIAANFFADPDTLVNFYKTNFSDVLKRSYEGSIVTELINGKLIANGKGTQKIKAPFFIATDIFGKTIKLKNDLGKRMLLINFWASWCGPCVAELPAIKKIEKKYPSSLLKIISVSYDSDSSAFIRAVKKYSMDWTNIYRDKYLGDKFGGVASLPMLYLIDNEGNIIYNRSNDETDFEKLEKLNAILEKHMQ